MDGTRLPFRRILDNLLLVARERPIVIQAMLLTLDGAGPGRRRDRRLGREDARDRRGGGRIDHVQVYTVARTPSDPRCGPLDPERLEAIAASARAAGLRASVYA